MQGRDVRVFYLIVDNKTSILIERSLIKEGSFHMHKEIVVKNFIVFEGCEGSGKSTQVKLLVGRLEKVGRRVWPTKEPGGTPYGNKIRDLLLFEKPTGGIDPLTEFLLFEAGRAEHMKVIQDQLKRGGIVVCDRFSSSTFAYQGYARGLFPDHKEFMESIDVHVRQGVRPGLIFLLDQDSVIGLKRKEDQKARNRFEEENLTFHQKVREGFLELARTDISSKWKKIDASKNIEAIEKEIWEITKKHLGIE